MSTLLRLCTAGSVDDGKSTLIGRLLYEARLRMGRRLAIEHPAEADLVIPVPDSAVPAALGYAEQSGLPFREGLIKNRYVGRTFIQPAQTSREASVRLKFNPLPEVLADKRVVVVDDSIVRGTTLGPIIAMLRRAGTYYVIGYGGVLQVPAIDIISTEINFLGNLVGTYNDLVELMTLTAQGRVALRTQRYPLDAVNDAMDDLERGRLHGRGILVPAR